MSTSRRSFLSAAGTSAAAVTARSLLPSDAAAASTPAGATARSHSGWLRIADGTELFVRDWGSGRPVVLTHAWPMSADCWDPVAVGLVDAGFRVITYDRRGFGRSSQPARGYHYDQLADDLAEVIAATGVRDALLGGFSMGGGEVVRYFSRHGGRHVSQAALVASVVPGLAKGPDNPNGVDAAFFDGLKENLRKDRLNFLGPLLRDAFFDLKGSANASAPITQAVVDWALGQGMQAGLPALLGCVEAFGKENLWPDLAAVTVPTLILHGVADIPVPIELTARRAARGIANSTLIEYAGTSHGILVSERERVVRDLVKFLNKGDRSI